VSANSGQTTWLLSKTRENAANLAELKAERRYAMGTQGEIARTL
jgi:hypothetical protein